MKTVTLWVCMYFGLFGFATAQTALTDFVFIENAVDTVSLKAVQSYNIVLKPKDNLQKTFTILKQKSMEKGANCFFLKRFQYDSSSHVLTIVLNTYSADQAIREGIVLSYPQKKICVMTDINFDQKVYSFNINGDEKTVKSGKFYTYAVQSESLTKLNKGGITGKTIKVKLDTHQTAQFFSLSRFGYEGAAVVPYPTAGGAGLGAGAMFSSGSIFEMDTALGLMLIHVLSEETYTP